MQVNIADDVNKMNCLCHFIGTWYKQGLRRICWSTIHRQRIVKGVVAQLVERVVRNDKARGSIPLSSTTYRLGNVALDSVHGEGRGSYSIF
jgi:hypothetical protein